ncbi:MAG: hypothetical protein ABH834_08545 [Candidatus Altiarchaeota archaeon]
MADFEEIKKGEKTFAIIISSDFSCHGTRFFTPDDYSQQLGFIRQDKGDVIKAHCHKPNERTITLTQEVLFVRKGKVKVRLYDDDKTFVCDRVLRRGDVIILVSGGHGFEFLDETEIIEVKQGPYAGVDDKEWF